MYEDKYSLHSLISSGVKAVVLRHTTSSQVIPTLQ